MSVSFSIMSRVPAAFLSPAVYPGGRVKPAGQVSMGMCGTNPSGSKYVYDSAGRKVPLPPTAVGCNDSGEPVDASGNVIPLDPFNTCGSGTSDQGRVGFNTSIDANGNRIRIPNNAVGCDAAGHAIDADGNVIGAPLSPVTQVAIPVDVPAPAPAPAPSPNQPLYDTVGTVIGVAGSTIATALENNNQLQIAQIQGQLQRSMAELQIKAQQSAAAGNLSLAQFQSQQAAQLQQFSNDVLNKGQSTTTMYLIGGVVVLGLIAFLATRR